MHTETTYSISVTATSLGQQHWATLLAKHPLGYTMPGIGPSSLASAGTCSGIRLSQTFRRQCCSHA